MKFCCRCPSRATCTRTAGPSILSRQAAREIGDGERVEAVGYARQGQALALLEGIQGADQGRLHGNRSNLSGQERARDQLWMGDACV